MSKVKQVEPIVDQPSGNAGIGGSLKWIEGREVKARQRVESAERELTKLRARQRGKLPDDIPAEWATELQRAESEYESAKSEHFQLAGHLLKLDPKVTPEKRDAGEKINQSEASRILTMSVVNLRFAWLDILSECCRQAALCNNEDEAILKLKPKFNEYLEMTIERVLNEEQLPKWAADSMKEGL